MNDAKKLLDDAAKGAHDALEKLLEGQPEATLAKLLVVIAAYATMTPWLLAAEPLLQRLFERVSNKRGKDAVAGIAAEVSTEEGYRRTAAEVMRLLGPALKVLMKEERARGASSLNQAIEIIETSAEETVVRLAVLLSRMEERLARPAAATIRAPFVANPIVRGPTTMMRAAARTGAQEEVEVLAVRYGATPRVQFDLTNMASVDARIVGVHIEVVEFTDIDIKEVWFFYGMTKPIRRYSCAVQPRAGRYLCVPKESDPEQVLVLTPGELETFAVDLAIEPREGLYRVRAGIDFSAGGETNSQTLDTVLEFGVFDEGHEVLRDERRWEGGDCVREAEAKMIEIWGASARNAKGPATRGA